MASSGSQTPISSNSIPTLWDVFLSFHGKDTRYKFTSHLYAALDRHGIRTFKDDPELRSGEVISDALIKAIKESKTYIVVLSENYAFSPWCLDELVEIINCHKTMKTLVIPVFYNIDPSVVRHQNGRFAEAFEKHEIRFDGEMEKVKKWRLTLKQVADFSGKHVDETRSEADIVNEVVDEILLNINPKNLEVAKYPVGLDSRVKGITPLLSSDTGVIRFGIYGMSGVGKTTLAKALYNQLLPGSFHGSCFLANVREVSGTEKGLESLQQQLIDDVLKSKKKVEVHNAEEGKKLIGARIGSNKVLVVLDDLDLHKQYEFLVGTFASGSVVIITTTNEGILDTIEVDLKHRYMVKELDDADSLALFTRHAFGNDQPNNTLMAWSKDILRHAGGLPLALEVFGSNLYKQSEVGWKSFIEKLQRIPNSSIEQKLMISLDASELDDPMLKKIFLDIACFFIGWEKESTVKILETYYPYADHKINNLKKRCLLKINDRNVLGIHDLLLRMGRKIARNSSDEPRKHSRLWISKEICDVMKKGKGTKAIEGIVHHNFDNKDASEEVSFATKTFKRMSKLRFLYLGNVNLTGSFEQSLEELRWLRWHGCPLNCLPSEFYPQKLVILELPYSQMRTMWEPNRVFENLKALDMSYSQRLDTTPNFAKLTCLETLKFEYCTRLKDVHISIGSLVRLVSLNLRSCGSLIRLPDTICELRALEVLNIGGCHSLEALPIELGKIESLKELKGEGLAVSKLPDSIRRLGELVELRLSDNYKLESLPETICNLTTLEVLNIADCISLNALPIELGNIKSLKKLHAEKLTILKLPDSIGRLRELVELKLSNNKNLKRLPDTICNLRALEVLNIDNCSSLETLPIELGNIESLKELKGEGLAVSKLPDSIGRLTKLVELRLSNNENLETLPDTIGNMRSLEIITIDSCTKLKDLPDQLWKITSLRELDARGATMLKKLPDKESSEIASSLQKLDLSYTGLTALPSGFGQLPNLEFLNLTECAHLPSIAELPLNLKRIRAVGCTSLKRLPNLSNLKQLVILDLTNCSCLTEIQGLEELISIRELHLGGCNSFLLAYTFTKSFFQVYSGFGQEIKIYSWSRDFPDWISRSSNLSSTVSLDLSPNVSYNFLATIICFTEFENSEIHGTDYSVKTATSEFICNGDHNYIPGYYDSWMAIVPRSIFSFRDGDNRLELTAESEIFGIHLLHKTDITVIGEYDRVTVESSKQQPVLPTYASSKNEEEELMSTNTEVMEEGAERQDELNGLRRSKRQIKEPTRLRYYHRDKLERKQ